jgi:hypothetical protein
MELHVARQITKTLPFRYDSSILSTLAFGYDPKIAPDRSFQSCPSEEIMTRNVSGTVFVSPKSKKMSVTSRLTTASLFIVFFLTGSVVYAQNANTTHVFPTSWTVSLAMDGYIRLD